NQMPDEHGELQDDAGLQLAEWMLKACPYTSRIVVTTFGSIELVKRAISKQLVNGYYSKDDISAGRVKSLTELVGDILKKRLTPLVLKNESIIHVDSLDLWDEVGIVDKDVYHTGVGTVQFEHLGIVKAHLHRAADVARIRPGSKVVGRSVFAGEIEVLPYD